MDAQPQVNGINLDDVIVPKQNDKKKVARRRWAILAKALKVCADFFCEPCFVFNSRFLWQSPAGSEPSSPTDEFSLRRISSFMLLSTTRLDSAPIHILDTHIQNKVKNYSWYRYTMNVDGVDYCVNVSHRNRTFSAEDLMGFNNTGNVCIWPSEETLAYYIAANWHLFKNKTVIELGGGMSCLAGLFCAKYGGPKCVTLTDGNKISIDNVQISLCGNSFPCPVDSRILKWGRNEIRSTFDAILCADCLFFDDARSDLVETLWQLLKVDGLALVMAPMRGHTLETFMLQCDKIGFRCRKIVNYNKTIWEKHLSLLDSPEYNENVHYPILIELTKV